MKHFLPHFIQEHYRNGIQEGSLRACTMFADLSGFTHLTDSLMQRGPEGAEELSDILKHIFQPTVAMVYEEGGFIPYFAGDSFTAIVPISKDEEAPAVARKALYTAHRMVSRFQREQSDKNSILSEHNIGLKVGLSEGEVHWGIVGERRKAFYFRGAPIDGCAEAQTRSQHLEMVGDSHILRLLSPDFVASEAVSDVYSKLKLISAAMPDSGQPVAVKLPDPDPAITADFYASEVFENQDIGEFRNVVSVFISFEGVVSHESLNHFASIVLDHSLDFGGYFKEIDFGDKGGVMFCLFGAPIAFENNTERALEFLGAVQEDLRSLQSLTGARYRIGIASGQAFAGVIGSKERCQYAAVGARVNLGARLMMKADWSVMADENVSRNRNFKFSYSGDGEYKGFKINLYQPIR
ncbi:MAG: adenylate/guanylate cyclase domain-containing protein [Saprospiraceae bacterium]